MLNSDILIGIIFFLLLSLNLWLIIYQEGKWLLKSILILLSSYFTFTLFFNLDNIKGWPSTNTPDRIILLQMLVIEPNLKAGQEGCIYYWGIPLEENEKLAENKWSFFLDLTKQRKGEPRSYKTHYNRSAHEDLDKAQDLMNKNQMVVWKFNIGQPSDEDINNQSSQNGDDNLNNNDGENGDQRSPNEKHFYIMPKPKLPLKKR